MSHTDPLTPIRINRLQYFGILTVFFLFHILFGEEARRFVTGTNGIIESPATVSAMFYIYFFLVSFAVCFRLNDIGIRKSGTLSCLWFIASSVLTSWAMGAALHLKNSNHNEELLHNYLLASIAMQLFLLITNAVLLLTPQKETIENIKQYFSYLKEKHALKRQKLKIDRQEELRKLRAQIKDIE